MNANIRKILEAVAENNGDRLIEQPECNADYCRDCGRTHCHADFFEAQCAGQITRFNR